jgi:UDP-N-acetylglucosamine 3-dehydrogenase
MIRVGILGAGGMGNAHARQYRKMPDVELTFFDPIQDKANAFCQRWNCGVAGSADEILSTCDVVDICLPTDLHHEWALKTIAEGKALFLEKPIARTLEEAAEIVEAAERASVPFMPGQVVRFFAEFSTGNRLVREGKVGTPAAARTRRGGPPPAGADRGWFMDHARSGGVLLDLAIHDFDWLRWTLGEVKHLYSRTVGAKTLQGADYGLTTLTFDNGAVGHVEATWMDPAGFRVTFEVAGSAGLISYDSRENAALRTTAGDIRATETPLHGLDDPYYLELRSFIDSIQTSTPPPVTGYDGFMAVSIAMAALESAQTDRVVAPTR